MAKGRVEIKELREEILKEGRQEEERRESANIYVGTRG